MIPGTTSQHAPAPPELTPRERRLLDALAAFAGRASQSTDIALQSAAKQMLNELRNLRR